VGIDLFGRQPLGKHSKSQRGRLENGGTLVIKCALRKQVMSMWTGTKCLSVVSFG
jgi:hypothetical protein